MKGQRPTLVIDQINHLPYNLILNLQERAKQWADEKKLRVVFVVSSGDAFRFMAGASYAYDFVRPRSMVENALWG